MSVKRNITTESIYPQGELICSVCGKKFKANEKTRFIIAGGYTCDWNCFSDEYKKREAERKENKNNKKQKK